MWDEVGNQEAIGAEEDDGVERDKDGGEDAGDDGLPSHTNAGPDASKKKVEGRGEGGG